MTQQINLYSPLFRKQKKVFSALAMLQAIALVVLGVAVFYVYVSLESSLLQIRVAESDEQLRSELERLKVYSAGDGPEALKMLADRRKALEATLGERHRTVQALAEVGGGGNDNDGYSESLRALARVSMQGLWLTRVQFSENEAEVAIAGRATHPELVASYLERLRREPALRGRAFSRLEIRRGAKGDAAGTVDFVLSSTPAEQKR